MEFSAFLSMTHFLILPTPGQAQNFASNSYDKVKQSKSLIKIHKSQQGLLYSGKSHLTWKEAILRNFTDYIYYLK